MQRASELPRVGRSPQEVRTAKAFKHMGILARQNQIVCFECEGVFENPNVKRDRHGDIVAMDYPKRCECCGFDYTFQKHYCMPDHVILGTGGRYGAVFNDGEVHDRLPVKRKDERKRSWLREHGWTVFAIRNEAVDNMEQMNLRIWCVGVNTAVMDSGLYSKAIDGEKEMVGIG